MCTISVIPVRSPLGVERVQFGAATGFRIVCNRDEDRRRAPAGQPKWRAIDRAGIAGSRAIWPMDMEAGGTWIAAGEHGLALCLLNLNPEPPLNLRGVRGLKSRGLIIPALIGATDVREAMKRLERLSLKHFAPFRLVGVDGRTPTLAVSEARWDRTQLVVSGHDERPMCFASSGLGDSRVAARLDLFEEMVIDGEGAIADRQDEFHRHTWPDRPEISVLMSRDEARTVSVTTVEAIPDGRGMWDITMEYQPVRAETEVAAVTARRAAGMR
jgi:hypothetical protein